ncbi:unnamed protein product [Moneuplotes crassus]|uniref:Uncharacterized protein n=2 Tax=Euplotes crassus TaxID=5936 RepID=A0AAD1UIR6_EUPCR|nr:unnamed protein product [Moneuplotes crassus]
MSQSPQRRDFSFATPAKNRREIPGAHSCSREVTSYTRIIESIIKKTYGQDHGKFLVPALEWLKDCSLNEKKGLKVIHMVVKNKGLKTFKPINKKPEVKEIIDLKNLEIKDAIKEYEKLKLKTAYGSFYGRKPALEDLTDTTILNSQKFSQLPCTKILTKQARDALDSWQQIEPEKEYKGIALSTLRSLNTHVLKSEPNTSSSRVFHRNFKPSELSKVERYDKLIETISMRVKNKFFEESKAKNITNKIAVPSQIMDKLAKMKSSKIYGRALSRRKYLHFVKGSISTINNGQPMMFEDASTKISGSIPKPSSLAKAKNYGSLFKISVGGGACIPDTRYLSIENSKKSSIESNFEKVHHSMNNTIRRHLPNTSHHSYAKSELKRGLSMGY